MSNLDEEGFLATEVSEVVTQTHNRYRPWMEVFLDVNKVSVKAQHELQVTPNDLQDLLCAVLFSRILSSLQGAHLLIERGMKVQARALVRVAIEAMFSLLAVAKSEKVARKFVDAHHIQRRRMIRKVMEWESPDLMKVAAEVATPEMIAEIEEAIEAAEASELTVKQLSKDAGLHDWYLTAYTLLSSSVHSSVGDLESHVSADDDGMIIELKNEPDLEGLHILITMASEVALRALKCASDRFQLNLDDYYNTSYEKLRSLKEALG